MNQKDFDETIFAKMIEAEDKKLVCAKCRFTVKLTNEFWWEVMEYKHEDQFICSNCFEELAENACKEFLERTK